METSAPLFIGGPSKTAITLDGCRLSIPVNHYLSMQIRRTSMHICFRPPVAGEVRRHWRSDGTDQAISWFPDAELLHNHVTTKEES